MKRRTLILGGIATALVRNAAATTAPIATQIGPGFSSYLDTPVIVKQTCPQWCWAASSSMIFAMHNHPVDQQKIVARVFGGLVCLPANSGITIATVLSTPWLDDNNVMFNPTVSSAYDYGAGYYAINNDIIIDEIANNRPLLYGNRHHAMVVSRVDYVRTATGTQVLSVWVFDPFPSSPDFHPLSQAEMVGQHAGGDMAFLAAVHI